MTNFIFRRLIWMVITLWAVFTVSFFLMHSIPGGPFSGEKALDPLIEENFKRKYDLDKSLPEQYLLRLGDVVRLDMGLCMKLEYPANKVIADGLPISALLGSLALASAFLVGVTAGIVSAVARGSATDVGLMAIATLGIALPNFVVAGVSILVFVFWLQWLPAAGWGSIEQLILPSICLGAPYAASVARIARTGMLDVLSQDHIRTARAKGLSPLKVVLKHAMPTAMLPVVSFLGPAVAGILTGSPVVEQIFAIPGLGWHFVQSAILRDYTLAMALVLVYTALLYTMNFVVDLCYSLLDPRIEWK
ncbi:MAG: ABC transporter permease [Planctomycetota bacterium]